MSKLLYVGQQVADKLKDAIHENLPRYLEGDFLDLEGAGDWRIPLSVDADIHQLKNLSPNGKPADEILNSLRVGRALEGLTPTLARENRVWIRLSHVECLEYSRERWLPKNADEEKLASQIYKHFFAPTLTACRDDHAVSRLWWNYHISKTLIPEDPETALALILARADIRLSFLERPGLAARPSLARGIIRSLQKHEILVKNEEVFRNFIKKVNLSGAGIAFEVWDNGKIDIFLDKCLEETKNKS